MKTLITKSIIILVITVCIGSFSGYALANKNCQKWPNNFSWLNSWENKQDNKNKDNNNCNNNGGHDCENNKKIDLKIGSQCHYYNYDSQNENSIREGELTGYINIGCFF